MQWSRSVCWLLLILHQECLGTWPPSVEDALVDLFGLAYTRGDFLLGTSTAAYQVEGAWDEGGKKPSIWDVFSHLPGKVQDNGNGDIANNFYELYEKDLDLVSSYGMNAFRYSIAWPRIFPSAVGGVPHGNPTGVEFYKNVTSGLLARNITPLVTMYHWDLPSHLDWLSTTVVDSYLEYAEFLFQTFPEVKNWITFNEPWTFCFMGYGIGVHAPGVLGEQYTCGHNVLKAHAKAVALYKRKYQKRSGGKIGITLNYDWAYPWNATDVADQEAANLSHDFHLGWFAEPIFVTGDYPASMRKRMGEQLPHFTESEKKEIKGSHDGVYYLQTYSATYAKATTINLMGFEHTAVGPDESLIGPQADSPWLHVVPEGMYAHLDYVHKHYHPQGIVITENGVDIVGENNLSVAEAVHDKFRVDYYKQYLNQVAMATRDGVPVKGYFAWSLLDNFEWSNGYSCRFGITHVNYTTQVRTPKDSARWLRWLASKMQNMASIDDRIANTLKDRPDFFLGSATAAYQVEGAWNESGREESIWDVWSHLPGKVMHGDTGDVADNFYNLYRSDLNLVADYGMNAFRFSVSWPRIYPAGSDGVRYKNPEGVAFYKNLTSGLVARGITPMMTIYHWDLPAQLDWANESTVDAFVEYAEVLFQTFPEVKHWMTFNEPWTFCFLGYGIGAHAPGKSGQQYLCGHHVLLAHAKTVELFRERYAGISRWQFGANAEQTAPSGQIGITLNYDWAFPWNASDPADQEAALLSHDFNLGWFAEPIFLTGDYPASMRERVNEVLPNFTEAEKLIVKGSYIGVYYLQTYSCNYAKAASDSRPEGYEHTPRGMDGSLIGRQAASVWLHVVPEEIYAHLEFVHKKYHPPAIIVTENGVDVPGENDMSFDEVVHDTFRVDYYKMYMDQVFRAVRDGVPVIGYFAWSLLDNFEWGDGYTSRFGLTYVDYKTEKRYPKDSAKWFTYLTHRIANEKKRSHESSGKEPQTQTKERLTAPPIIEPVTPPEKQEGSGFDNWWPRLAVLFVAIAIVTFLLCRSQKRQLVPSDAADEDMEESFRLEDSLTEDESKA